mgnify:CR=1 FL=1
MKQRQRASIRLTSGQNGVPEEYVLQVQHYLAVCGMNKAYIAALIGGNENLSSLQFTEMIH